MSSAPSASRLSSVDALRGLAVAAMLLVNNAGDWNHMYPWLEHADWNGCHPADFIFPLFLFVVGVSTTLALTPALAAGQPRGTLLTRVLVRAARLVLLGLALHLLAHWTIPGREFRLMGVLQRIGICFAVAGTVVLWLRPVAQWMGIAVLLVGYGAILLIGGTEPGLNPADRIDDAVLGPLAYAFDSATRTFHDPEGMLSTLGAIATTLLGVRAGAVLREKSMRTLVLGGGIGIALGVASMFRLPLNKALWTPSFVLFTGGAAALALALAHALIDRRGWPPIGRSFGINAILAYAGAWLCVCLLAGAGWLEPLYRHTFGALFASRFGDEFASAMWAVSFTAVFWLLMRWCDRRGWVLKI